MTYEEKFSTFIQMCKTAKEKEGEGVLIYQPEVLGDTYEEIVKSLNYLADAELVLRIAPRKKRKTRSV